MGDEELDFEEQYSKIFRDNSKMASSDEQFALEIIHKFNIDRDTIDCMPAFVESLKPLFLEKEDK